MGVKNYKHIQVPIDPLSLHDGIVIFDHTRAGGLFISGLTRIGDHFDLLPRLREEHVNERGKLLIRVAILVFLAASFSH